MNGISCIEFIVKMCCPPIRREPPAAVSRHGNSGESILAINIQAEHLGIRIRHSGCTFPGVGSSSGNRLRSCAPHRGAFRPTSASKLSDQIIFVAPSRQPRFLVVIRHDSHLPQLHYQETSCNHDRVSRIAHRSPGRKLRLG